MLAPWKKSYDRSSSIQSLSRVRLFVTPCIIKSIKGLLNNKGGGQGPGASFLDQLLELVSQPGFLGLWLLPFHAAARAANDAICVAPGG